MNDQIASSGQTAAPGKSGGGFLVGLVIGVVVGALAAAWIQPMLSSRPAITPHEFDASPATEAERNDRNARPSDMTPEFDAGLEDAEGSVEDAIDEVAEDAAEGDPAPAEPGTPEPGDGR